MSRSDDETIGEYSSLRRRSHVAYLNAVFTMAGTVRARHASAVLSCLALDPIVEERMVKDLSGRARARGRSGNLMTTEEKGSTRLLLLAVQGVESTRTAY
jgi:hypothetical protein